MKRDAFDVSQMDLRFCKKNKVNKKNRSTLLSNYYAAGGFTCLDKDS